MLLLLIFGLLRLDLLECSKPRSVNLALETVLEFDKDADLALVDTVQDFLTKVKSTIEESRLNVDTRRTNSVSFTDLLEQLIFILQSYNDIDFKTLLESIYEEIHNIDLNNCDNDVEEDESNFRDFLHDRLTEFKKTPLSDVRRNLDDALRKMRDDEYKKESALFRFLDAFLKKRSQDKFQNILNHLQLFRRHRDGANIKLRSIVRSSVSLVISDYYCQLEKGQRREIKQLVKYFLATKSNTKSKMLKNNSQLRIEVRDRMKTASSFKNRHVPSRWKHNKEKYEFGAIQMYKTFTGAEETNGDSNLQSFFNKRDRDDINSQWINAQTKYQNESEIPIRGSREIVKIRKRKPKTRQTKGEYYDKPNEYKSKESNEHKKKRKRFRIKNGRTSNRKKEKRVLKTTQNVQLVSRHADTDDNKNKEMLHKLLSKNDDTEYEGKSESNELPLWKKYTKKRANKLKTFITLYPERIDIYRANTLTTERNGNLDAERKTFTFKSDLSKDYKIVTTHAEIDIDIDKSLLKPESFYKSLYPETKGNRNKESHQRKQRLKKTKMRAKSKSPIDSTFRNHENILVETSSIRTSNVNYDTDSVEYFGSLYSHKNGHKEVKGFRKSNDKDELKITTTVRLENITTVSTDKEKNVTNAIKNENKDDSRSEEVTETYGTLAFWGGTNEPSTTKPDTVTENFDILNVTDPTTRHFEMPAEKQMNVSTTEIVFRSQDLNETRDGRKNIFEAYNINATETKSTNLNNVLNVSNVFNIINTTNVKENNFINKTNATIAANVTKPLLLRRYLENMAINEISDDEKKTRIKSRIQEDLKKLFITTTLKTTPKDPIDELEEAFNL